MPKTIQIRDVDDRHYAALVRRAAESGITVPELLRREIERLATRPSMHQWLEEINSRPVSNVTTEDILRDLDEIRGPWPDGGG
ncbi:MAG: hypothetical protein ACRD1K_12835 [Acidimicrobiales bacterium]